MLGQSPRNDELRLTERRLDEMIDTRKALCKLSQEIPWEEIKKDFAHLYSNTGRPSASVRTVAGLLMLKQLYNESDESVVERWVENPYWQYFTGEIFFQWKAPIDPSDLVHFRKRIGSAGAEKILEYSLRVHGKKAVEKVAIVDTTVQEKNITFPTDVKLCRKVIHRVRKIAKTEGLALKQSYVRVEKRLLLTQRFHRSPKRQTEARRAQRKLKTIAGRLVREIEKKLSPYVLTQYERDLGLMKKIVKQKREDHQKVYSLHEPEVACIAKGKEYKRYEFGSKSAIMVGRKHGLIIGAMSFPDNRYDGRTTEDLLLSQERITGIKSEVLIGDRGFRGRKYFGETKLLTPTPPQESQSAHEKRMLRSYFRSRAGIEPRIGHLKSDFRLARNFLKGAIGDEINLFLACAAFNLRKRIREITSSFLAYWKYWIKVASSSIFILHTPRKQSF